MKMLDANQSVVLKKPYTTPKLTTHGDVATLTQHRDRDRDDEKDEKHGCASHLFDKVSCR
jgi:hypothetical protein